MGSLESVKVALLLGTVLLVGGPLFLILIWAPSLAAVAMTDGQTQAAEAVRRRIRLGTAAGAALVLIAGLADLLRVAAALTGEAWFSGSTLTQGVAFATGTGLGRIMMLRLLLGIVAWAATWLPLAGPTRWVQSALGLPLLIAISLTGHSAAAAGAVWAPVAADVVHLAATSAWYGGLLYLAVLPWRRLRQADYAPLLAAVAERFSRLGLTAVFVLTLTGLYMASLRLYGIRALVEHPYGETLLFKLSFLGGVLVLAAVNLLVVKPRLRTGAGAESVRRVLQGLVVGEALLGLVVLGAAGVLSTAAPPAGEPVRIAITLEDGQILPRTLAIPRNKPVLLSVTNRGSQQHSYVVRAIPHQMISGGHQHGTSDDMMLFVDPGRTESLQFIARRAGQYQVYCMIGHHMEAGEIATMTVR